MLTPPGEPIPEAATEKILKETKGTPDFGPLLLQIVMESIICS